MHTKNNDYQGTVLEVVKAAVAFTKQKFRIKRF